MEPAILVIVLALAVELLIYALFSFNSGIAGYLRGRGVSVYPFTVLIDLGKVPRFRTIERSKRLRSVLLITGLANFLALVAMFYWYIAPSVKALLEALVRVKVPESPFIPIVPGVTVNVSTFLYILLALSIGVALHELFHAIAAYSVGWRIDAWGVGVFLIFPLAYVKINEEDYKQAKLKCKATVLTAGVLANTILFLIAISLAPVVASHITSAVVIVGLDESDPTAPAVMARIPCPSIIYSINATRVSSIGDLRDYLVRYGNTSVTYVIRLSKAELLGEVVRSVGSCKEYVVRKPAGRWRLGIYLSELPTYGTPAYIIALARFTYWFEVVNVSLAMLNAAPIYISDGGRLVTEVLGRVKLKAVNHVIQATTAFLIAVFLISSLAKYI